MDELETLLNATETTPKKTPVQVVDRTSGAPAWVRAMVGGVNDQDRLAALQTFAPDARPQGDDNFVYTDPKTNQPTLYNPGFFNDPNGAIASLMRDFLVQGGGAVGGTFGAAGGAPAGGFGAIPGAIAGKMLGGTAGGQLSDIIAHSIMGAPDTTDLTQKATQMGVDAISLPVGDKLGGLISSGFSKVAALPSMGKQFLNKVFVGNDVPELAAMMRALGIEPNLANTADTGVAKSVRAALAALPGSSNTMQNSARATMQQLENATTGLADDIAAGSSGLSANRTGATLRQATQSAADDLIAAEGKVFADAEAKNAAAQVSPDNLVNFVQGRQQELGRSALGRPGESAALNFLDKKTVGAFRPEQAVDDAAAMATEPLPFAQARGLRTEVGARSRAPGLTAEQISGKPIYKQAYGALSADIEAALTPEGRAAMQAADESWNMIQNTVLPEFERVINANSDAAAYDSLVNMLQHGPENAGILKKYLAPEKWNQFVGTMVSKLGTKADGDAFSPARFLTNWRKLGAKGPEAKQLLFDRPEISNRLDRLANIMDKMQKAEAMANRSNTAGTSWLQRLMTNPAAMFATGGTLSGLTGADPALGAGLGVAYAFGVPAAASRFMTNPKALDELIAFGAKELQHGPAPTNAFLQLMTRLGAQESLEGIAVPDQPANQTPDDLDALLQQGGQ